MNLVLQKHSRGCGVACLSMLLGIAYDSIWLELYGKMGKTDGMYTSDLGKLLEQHGLKVQSMVYPEKRGGELTGLPAFYGADVLLLQVRVFPDSPCDHFVLMDAEGKYYDPMFGHTTLERYDQKPFAALPISFPKQSGQSTEQPVG